MQSFGSGTVAGHPFVHAGASPRTLLVIPGLNDPLLRAGDNRWFDLALWRFCGRYAADRTVYLVSRPPGFGGSTTRELAESYRNVLEAVGPADVMGFSMGGLVVQHLARTAPDLVERAVFALAADRLSDYGKAIVRRWIGHADREEWGRIYDEAARTVATGSLARALSLAGRLYGRLAGGPTHPAEFGRAANAALAHDASEWLPEIDAPTLVLGGGDDPFFERTAYWRTANALPRSKLVCFEEVGHEVVLERPERFDRAVLSFLD